MCVYVQTYVYRESRNIIQVITVPAGKKMKKNLQFQARLNPPSYVSGSETKMSISHLACHLPVPAAQHVCLQQNKENDSNVISFLRTDKEETVIRSVR